MTDTGVADPWGLPPGAVQVTPQPGGSVAPVAGGAAYVPDPQGPGYYRDQSGQQYQVVQPPSSPPPAATATPVSATVDDPWAAQTAADAIQAPAGSNDPAYQQDKTLGLTGLGPSTLQPGPADEGPVSAFVRNAANSVTGGWSDKIQAGLNTIPTLLSGGDAGSTFTRNLNAEQAASFNAKAQHPAASFAGAVPGVIAQGLLAPELKGAGLFGPMLTGGALGALDATGSARGDAGSLLGDAAGGALAGAAAGGLFHGLAAPSAASGDLAPYERVGIDPSLAVNGGRSTQQIAQTMKGLPFVGVPLANAADRTAAQLSSGLKSTAANLGPADSAFTAGSALQSGAAQAVKGMKTTADRLYAPVNELAADQTPIPLTNTAQTIAGHFAQFPTIPDWLAKQAPKLVQVQDAINQGNGALTFGEMQALRSDVGGMTKDMTINSADQRRLKTVYSAMTQDMQAGAGQIGGPDAQNALSRADTYYAAAHARADDVLASTLNAPSPEAAYNRVVAAAQGGGRADLQNVQRLKRSLDPDAWNNFTAGTIQTMGLAPDGSFSPSTFATQYAKLTPDGKAAVFGRGGLSADMDAFASIAKDQQAASKFYNHSNSGHAVGVMGGLMAAGEAYKEGGAGGLGIMAAMGTLGYGAARLLASPGFARTMLKATQAQPGMVDSLFGNYAAAHPSIAPYVDTLRAKLPTTANAATQGTLASRTPPQLPPQGQ